MTCKDKIFFANHKKKFQHFFRQPISCPPKITSQVLFRPATGQFSQPKCRGENRLKTAISRHKTQADQTIKMTKWHGATKHYAIILKSYHTISSWDIANHNRTHSSTFVLWTTSLAQKLQTWE